jgi:hypothetical protein
LAIANLLIKRTDKKLEHGAAPTLAAAACPAAVG